MERELFVPIGKDVMRTGVATVVTTLVGDTGLAETSKICTYDVSKVQEGVLAAVCEYAQTPNVCVPPVLLILAPLQLCCNSPVPVVLQPLVEAQTGAPALPK
jgi:hypothetical protein